MGGGPTGAFLLVLRFLLEVAALCCIGLGATSAGGPLAVRVLLACIAVAAAALAWARFAAPRSPRRLADPARLAFEAVFFAIAAAGLATAAGELWALAFLVVALADALAVRTVDDG